MTNILEKLFGSSARVKILRLFLLNPENLFVFRDVSRRTRVSPQIGRREILLLKKIGFLKEKEEKIEELIKLKKGKIKNRKKKIRGLKLDPLFPLLQPLRNILVTAAPLDREKLIKRLNSVGKIKLIILAGVFIQSEDSRTDLLLVGDSIRHSALEKLLNRLEAEIGRELTYAAFSTNEFLYRFGMYDHFIRDVLDYPHEKILNKLNI